MACYYQKMGGLAQQACTYILAVDSVKLGAQKLYVRGLGAPVTRLETLL